MHDKMLCFFFHPAMHSLLNTVSTTVFSKVTRLILSGGDGTLPVGQAKAWHAANAFARPTDNALSQVSALPPPVRMDRLGESVRNYHTQHAQPARTQNREISHTGRRKLYVCV